MIGTLEPVGCFAYSLNSGQKQTAHYRQEGDDDEQFDHGKGFSAHEGRSWRGNKALWGVGTSRVHGRTTYRQRQPTAPQGANALWEWPGLSLRSPGSPLRGFEDSAPATLVIPGKRAMGILRLNNGMAAAPP